MMEEKVNKVFIKFPPHLPASPPLLPNMPQMSFWLWAWGNQPTSALISSTCKNSMVWFKLWTWPQDLSYWAIGQFSNRLRQPSHTLYPKWSDSETNGRKHHYLVLGHYTHRNYVIFERREPNNDILFTNNRENHVLGV